MPKNKIKSKDPLDRFYTKPVVARDCIDLLLSYIDDPETTLFLEPSAGNGSFFKQLPSNKIGVDIDPQFDGIIEHDYLTFDAPKNCVVVGNPPYGSRNMLSKAFIKKSLTAKIIAFILPKVFKKETMQNVFPSDWRLVESVELPSNSFIFENEEYHVPSVFQIWTRDDDTLGVDLRESVQPVFTTTDFSFVDKDEADCFMFGASPAKLVDIDDVNDNNRGYWVSCDEDTKRRIMEIDWSRYALSSVSGGVAWFTKKQIINIYGEEYYGFRQ